MLIFGEREKPKNPEKNPPSYGENQQQTQATYDAGSGTQLVGGEHSHHYTTPAPPWIKHVTFQSTFLPWRGPFFFNKQK